MPPPTDPSRGEEPADWRELPLVKAVTARKPVSKGEQTFHRLVADIGQLRESLAAWQGWQSQYHQRLASEIEPLRRKMQASQAQLVEVIDRQLIEANVGRTLTRSQQSKLETIRNGLSAGLSDDPDDLDQRIEDPTLQESAAGHDGQDEGPLPDDPKVARNGAEVDPESGGWDESYDVEAQAHEEEVREAAREAARELARQAAAKARRARAAQHVGLSFRVVYRKLVSALHPDRERDDEARQRKTALMQRVNRAYEANDLLSLLGLQLEIEQIDAGHLGSVPPKRLAHYNQVLREQVASLQGELSRLIEPFRQAAGGRVSATFMPTDADRLLNIEVARLKDAVRELQADLIAFRDLDWLRQMLDQQPRR